MKPAAAYTKDVRRIADADRDFAFLNVRSMAKHRQWHEWTSSHPVALHNPQPANVPADRVLHASDGNVRQRLLYHGHMWRRCFAAAVLGATLAGCTHILTVGAVAAQHTKRLDEATVVSADGVIVKVVRYREYRPFSGTEHSYTVQCRSAGTQGTAAVAGWQDRGWLTLSGSPDSSPSLAGLVSQLTREFQAYPGGVLVWKRGDAFPPRISVDGCATFHEWSPATVEQALIIPAEVWPREREPAPLEAKPFFCADERIDCRQFEFGGSRRMRYRDVEISSHGQISFIAASTALTVGELRVVSDDWGKTWRYFVRPQSQPPLPAMVRDNRC